MAMQWRVYKAGLDPTFGREQAGERPVLIISAEPLNDHYEVVAALPITSRKNNRPARLGEVLLPAGTAGLRLESIVLCYQIRAIDKQRLFFEYGEISDREIQGRIEQELADCLDLEVLRSPKQMDDS